MDLQYVATRDEMAAAEMLLEKDVLDLYREFAPETPMQEVEPPPFLDQLRFIAACPHLQFSVGLDTGKLK